MKRYLSIAEPVDGRPVRAPMRESRDAPEWELHSTQAIAIPAPKGLMIIMVYVWAQDEGATGKVGVA